MEAAKASTDKPFDFAAMSKVVTSSAKQEVIDDGRPPAEDVPVATPTNGDEHKAETKPEEDEDDLEIGDQLDSVGVPSPSVAGTAASSPSADVAADGSAQEVASDADVGTREDDATLQNPMDPRLAALAAANREEMDQRQQERMAPSGGRGGGGGPGLGAVLGAGLAGSFKLVSNGIKAVRNHDPSQPKHMGIAERRATRDPSSAEAYYKGKGDKVLKEKYYREIYGKVSDGIDAARAYENAFQNSVSEFNEILQQSPVASLAEKAQTSVGDYIHAVKNGTIKDAAAQSVIATLQQDPAFVSAEKSVIEAANGFKQKVGEVSKALESADSAFPGRLDTNLRRQQIADMAGGMENDEVAKSSEKIKQAMDEIKKLAESIKKMVMDVVNSVGSVFRPK